MYYQVQSYNGSLTDGVWCIPKRMRMSQSANCPRSTCDPPMELAIGGKYARPQGPAQTIAPGERYERTWIRGCRPVSSSLSARDLVALEASGTTAVVDGVSCSANGAWHGNRKCAGRKSLAN